MFVDRVRIWARAGKGGDGCVSFRRAKFEPKGGPDGGDGGKGGDILIKASHHMNNLVHLKYGPHHYADNGRQGGGQRKTGKSGKTHIIEVPVGTMILGLPTDPDHFDRPVDEQEAFLTIDITDSDQTYVLCAGGNGGKGNSNFKSSTNQAPRKFTKGKPGELGQFIFELKSIADIGLVGFPNAGKSSLLGALSQARPKVANYPFTTLRPSVGILEDENFNRITMADIPGLIEGAHEGVGLGHDFLRHVERCGVLLFVLDTAGIDGRDPLSDFHLLRKEVNLYQQELSKRPYLIVANKIDLPESEENLKILRQQLSGEIFEISIAEGIGLDALKARLHNLVKENRIDAIPMRKPTPRPVHEDEVIDMDDEEFEEDSDQPKYNAEGGYYELGEDEVNST